MSTFLNYRRVKPNFYLGGHKPLIFNCEYPNIYIEVHKKITGYKPIIISTSSSVKIIECPISEAVYTLNFVSVYTVKDTKLSIIHDYILLIM